MNFSSMPSHLRFELDITPPQRKQNFLNALNEPSELGLMGTYKSLCNFYETNPSAALAWDLQNLYQGTDTDTLPFSFPPST